MFYKRLRIFQMAAALGNFTQAAEALGMTQPNVTGQIRALEREMGVELFVRDGRQPRLTAAGAALRREAGTLLALTENAVRLARDAAGEAMSLRLGATMTAGGYVLPPLMARFMEKNPGFHLSLHIANTVVVEEKLKQRAFDLALVEGPFDENLFFSRELLRDELLLVGHPSLPIWEGKRLSVAALAEKKIRLLLREGGSGTRFHFDQFCRANNIDQSRFDIMEVAGFDALKLLLEERCGVTVISALAVSRELDEGRLRAAVPAEGRIRRPMNFIYLDGDARKNAEKFMDFCRGRLASGRPEKPSRPR